jgi:sugar lactone lactonase YvrE
MVVKKVFIASFNNTDAEYKTKFDFLGLGMNFSRMSCCQPHICSKPLENMKSITLVITFCLFALSVFAQTLSDIESAEFDPINHRFLVSNGSNVMEVNSNGQAIGEIGGGTPQAAYGMEVIGNTLFSIVSSSVRAYDLTTGGLISSISIAGASFLNGMASDGVSRVWVTDFGANKIHEIDYSDLQNPTYSTVVNNTSVTPNGICYDEANNRLVFVAWSGNSSDISAVSLVNYSLSTLVANASLNSIDGIDNDSYGNYFLASWTPQRITKYNSDFTISEVITVPGGLNNAADIAYAEEIDTLIIPNSGNNTVRFVGFQPVSSVGEGESVQVLPSCYPNPIQFESVITFYNKYSGKVRIEAIDMQGKVVYLLLEEQLPSAMQRIVIGDVPISVGKYLWRIQTEGEILTVPFLKQ